MKRMSFETYAYLKSLLEAEELKLERGFQTACFFIPKEPPRKNEESGVEKAHRVFQQECAKIQNLKEELHDGAAASYKDHPSADMRTFWGLK